MKRTLVRLSTEAEAVLSEHNWPGNVRELDNVVQRALILQQGNIIMPADLHMINGAIALQNALSVLAPAEIDMQEADDAGKLGNDLRQHEFQLIIDALKTARGSRKEAAERLAISPRTLRYKLAKIRESGLDLDQLLAN